MAAGAEVTLVVPSYWPDSGGERDLSAEDFEMVELPVHRPGDVNRHTYQDMSALTHVVRTQRPDVIDLHEEPVSLSSRQWLKVAGDIPVTMYTAQNLDKRFPPPFAQYEAAAYRRVDGLYPCTRQAAAVARGKGFTGPIEVLPLGVNPLLLPGQQSADDDEIRLGIIGRLVPQKGVRDAVRVLAHLLERRPARLLIVGEGGEAAPARSLAHELGVAHAVEFAPWKSAPELAALYRELHVVLVPSMSTATWVEQFGRIIIEAQAAGAVVGGYRSGAIGEVGDTACVLVPEGAVEQLSTALYGLLGAPDAYEKLRRTGLEQAAACSWETIATRQIGLYHRVANGGRERLTAPRSPRARRVSAVEEFGRPAELPGGVHRPFALPVLRRHGALARTLARMIDGATDVLTR
jgi:glycosyltransferase involved in cell wall biosynthesis